MPDIFAEVPEILTAPDYSKATTTTIHKIKTTDPPIFSKPRPMPLSKFEAA